MQKRNHFVRKANLVVPKACYLNAQRASTDYNDLVYVEGVCKMPEGVCFKHAWCEDTDGCVWDPTLGWRQDEHEYETVFIYTNPGNIVTIKYNVNNNWVEPIAESDMYWCEMLYGHIDVDSLDKAQKREVRRRVSDERNKWNLAELKCYTGYSND